MTQSLTPYADYLLQLDLEGSNLHSVEAKSVRESDLDVLYVHQMGGRNDPPSSNFILALPLSDIGRGRFDFGAGAFEAELGPGDVLVEPPGVACLYDIPDHAEVRDVILRYRSRPVADVKDFPALVRSTASEAEVEIQLLRRGEEELTLTVEGGPLGLAFRTLP